MYNRNDSIIDRNKRLSRRDQLIAARFFYWSEVKRLRYDDTLRTLCENEFFQGERTITNAIAEHDDYFIHLRQDKNALRSLSKEYPGFNWK